MDTREDADLQRRMEKLAALLKLNRVDIEAWTARARAAELRADRSEEQSEVDREAIAELRAEGLVSQEHVGQLQHALASSRVIGAAIGVLMANRNIGQDEALKVLKSASQRSNTKLRDLAAIIVAGADAAAR